MHFIEVTDRQPDNRAIVELKHAMSALGDFVEQAVWTVHHVASAGEDLFATGHSSDVLELLADSGNPITGEEIRAIAEDADQVIWGEFRGFKPADRSTPWITIVCFDSGSLEFHTEDDDVIRRIRQAFHNIADLPDWRLENIRNGRQSFTWDIDEAGNFHRVRIDP